SLPTVHRVEAGSAAITLRKNMATKDNDLAGMFGRLPSDQLKRLADMVGAELEKRGGKKNLGGMSAKEFRAYVDEQVRKADRAAGEADLRQQLGGKDQRDNKPTSKDQKEAENE